MSSSHAAKSYKELSQELADILSSLERGDLDIEEAVKCYERGFVVVNQLQEYLNSAENRVIELKASVRMTDDEDEE